MMDDHMHETVSLSGLAPRLPGGAFDMSGHMTVDDDRASLGLTNGLPWASKTLMRPAGAYRYLDEGHGQPLLMVHGNPTWSFYFRRLVQAFAPHYRTVVPDHLGCGRSAVPDPRRYGYHLRDRIDDLEALVKHLDLNDITLVLHDWGGMIGMGLAARQPQRIKRLVLSNTAAFGLPKTARLPWALRLARMPVVGRFLVQDLNLFVHGTLKTGVARRPLSPQVRRAYLDPWRRRTDRIAADRFVRDIPLSPSDFSYQAMQSISLALPRFAHTPALIVWGRRDFVFNETFLHEWQRRLPDAHVDAIADAGHLVLEDAPEHFVARLRSFLKRYG